jgi:hypothetical protein
MLRSIDRYVHLGDVPIHLDGASVDRCRATDSHADRRLLLRHPLERCLCEEVPLNLAYRWFCRLGLDGDLPDPSTFSKNRRGRFRDSALLRHTFETVWVAG